MNIGINDITAARRFLDHILLFDEILSAPFAPAKNIPRIGATRDESRNQGPAVAPAREHDHRGARPVFSPRRALLPAGETGAGKGTRSGRITEGRCFPATLQDDEGMTGSKSQLCRLGPVWRVTFPPNTSAGRSFGSLCRNGPHPRSSSEKLLSRIPGPSGHS